MLTIRSENKKIPKNYISPHKPSFVNLFSNMTNIKDFYLSDFKSKKHSPVLSSGDTKDTPNKQYNKNKQSTSVKKYTQSQIDKTGDKLYNEDQKYTEANMYMAPKLIQSDVQYISPKEYSTKKEHIAPKEYSVPEQYSAPKEYSAPKYNTDKTADDFIQGSYTTSRPWAFFSRGDSWIPPFTLPFPIELFPTEKVNIFHAGRGQWEGNHYAQPYCFRPAPLCFPNRGGGEFCRLQPFLFSPISLKGDDSFNSLSRFAVYGLYASI